MNDRWTPGIGDPGAIGWFTVAGYLMAAVCCSLAGWRRAGVSGRSRAFWGMLALTMLALGINKQLDLQSFLTQVARDMARSGGWYGARRALQAAFMSALALSGAVLVFVIWRHRSVLHCNMRIAIFGLFLVVAYVIFRAASFHHAGLGIDLPDTIRNSRWLLEVGGIVIVVFAALLERLAPAVHARRKGAWRVR
ncbi:hypothetical protein [Sphingomonas sp. Leaf231]|uniref:hypothetical protein n=1 Tax=Sphingomonas sp. Leaf231 TaxID=1736301 RepID=UPI0012E25F18|nr:hypothetical protein [Sphingomonas sp. Leaf231]